MVPPVLNLHRVISRSWGVALAVGLLAPALAACSGGNASDSKEAARIATAACGVFSHITPPAGAGQKAQVTYAKESYVAFLRSAELARRAAQLDSRWDALQSAAQTEAAAFEVIVKAADPASSGDVSPASVTQAATRATAARPRLIAQCSAADPGAFGSTATASPSPSAPN